MANSAENIIELFKTIPTGKKISFALIFLMVVGGFIAIRIRTNS